GREQEQLRPHERHDARALGKPLVPANADAEPRKMRVPHSESRVARGEIVLFLVARPIGDVRLAVHAEVGAVGVQDGDGIEVGGTRTLEEADRQHHPELARYRAEVTHGAILRGRARETQVTRVLLYAEIRRLEQLGQENDLRAPRGRLAPQLLRPGDVVPAVPVARHLDGGHRHRSRRAPEVLRVPGHHARFYWLAGLIARRSASERFTCSTMRMAVSSAMSPASPGTTGARPLRMHSR